MMLHFNDGTAEYIFSEDDSDEYYSDFQQIIFEKLGADAENIVARLREKAEYNVYKLDSDVAAYEGQLDSNAIAFMDILEVCDSVSTYVTEGKRINKQTLVNYLDEIKNLINNQT